MNHLSDQLEQENTVASQNSGDTSSSSVESSEPKKFVPTRPKRKVKKVCYLCKRGCLDINYKDVELLKNYLKKYNKILTHKVSGNCLKHQHQIANAIKRARFVALLPFVSS